MKVAELQLRVGAMGAALVRVNALLCFLHRLLPVDNRTRLRPLKLKMRILETMHEDDKALACARERLILVAGGMNAYSLGIGSVLIDYARCLLAAGTHTAEGLKICSRVLTIQALTHHPPASACARGRSGAPPAPLGIGEPDASAWATEFATFLETYREFIEDATRTALPGVDLAKHRADLAAARE